MRFPIRYDAPALMCQRCGEELFPRETAYRIHGQTICPDCLASYACEVFAPYRITVAQEAEL